MYLLHICYLLLLVNLFIPFTLSTSQQMRNVSDLNLADTGLGPRGGEILGPAIGANDSLSILDLSWNHISRRGAQAVVQGIQVS